MDWYDEFDTQSRLDEAKLACPYCGEPAEVWVDDGSEGEMVEDCAVCCRPWRVIVHRDLEGRAHVSLSRAQ